MAKLVPVAIAGIEVDCLLNKSETYTADIPSYTVEDGFAVSDSIILKPLELALSLVVSDTPVTWANRSGHSPKKGRTKQICDKLTKAFLKKQLVKVVTTNAIYTNMGITSLTIKNYANHADVDIRLRKVYVTSRKVVTINSSSTMSGATMENNGTAATSSTSSKTSGKSTGSNSGSSDKNGNDNSKKRASSVLYGLAGKLFS